MALDTVDALLAAAAAQGLQLADPDATLDTMGLDFVVTHARDAAGVAWVVRSPRRPDVAVAARHEGVVLRAVRGRLPVAVPDWRIHTEDLIAYPRLPGTPAVTLPDGAPRWNIIDPAAPASVFLDGVADVLVAMAAAADAAIAAGVKARTIEEERAEIARAIDAAVALLDPSPTVLARWRRWHADAAAWPTWRALVHGDLHPGHLLLADDARLTGVLDWTEARVGDPSVDLAMFFKAFGRGVLEDLAGRCAARDGRPWGALVAHAVERAAAFPALGAEWVARTGSTGLVDYLRAELAGSEP